MWVSVADLAGICQVTETGIYQWIKAGMPVAGKGKPGGNGRGATQLDLEACIRWYFAENHDRLELERARARLANEQADTSGLKNAETRSQIVRLPRVMKIVSAAMSIVRTNALAIPTKLAAALEGLDIAERKAAIEREVHYFLEGIANFDFRVLEDSHGAANGVQHGETPAPPDVKRVGRHVSRAKRRGKRKARKVANRDSGVPEGNS